MTDSSIESRFLDKVTPVTESGCWLWTGGVGSAGYGVFGVGRKNVSAHRMSYELHKGPIPGGMLVCHKCDVPACVNPDHLFLGTQTVNMRDMSRKGRGVIAGRQQIAPETASYIRAKYAEGETSERKLAAEIGVSRGCVSAVLKGRSFAWSRE